MAPKEQPRTRARIGHTNGPTHCTYTPDGTKLVTVGQNEVIRIYTSGSNNEPTNIDEMQGDRLGVAAANDFFVTCDEHGQVSKYSLSDNTFEEFLWTTSLPVRDVQISPNDEWVAIASDHLTVKLMKVSDKTSISLEGHMKPAKHVSYHPNGKYIAVSCSDGVVYIYKVSEEKGDLAGQVHSVIPRLETNSDSSSRVAWHPAGTAFAAPTATREIQMVSAGDWKVRGSFKDGHTGDITALAWSPNGALLVTAGRDRKVLLWEADTQQLIARYDYPNVMDVAWHPRNNILSLTTSEGEVYIHNDFVPEEHAALLGLTLRKAPLLNVAGPDGAQPGGPTKVALPQRARPPIELVGDGLDHIFAAAAESDMELDDDDQANGVVDEDDFVIDDDGAGYAAPNANGKRPSDYLGLGEEPGYKRHAIQAIWQPRRHEAFQPGSTPWNGDRRYLCLNFIGSIWTVEMDVDHKITVDFFDRSQHHNFHFTDTFGYDKACLSEHGALFSAQATEDREAVLFYRPHEMWSERNDWRTTLPKGEDVTAISLSDSYITVLTSANYIRVYTLFLTPYRVYRQKSAPAVTCASWRDYVLTMGNGPVGADGHTTLLYSIEDVKKDEMCQSEDVVALPPGVTLKSVFFSDVGDPCIYDSTGTLLTLLHWRNPTQGRWVPLLDTTQLQRLAAGKKTETYWPVAVADGKFHCIVLKGADEHPHFPQPLLSDFDFKIPIGSKGDDNDAEANAELRLTGEDKTRRVEEKYLRNSVLASMLLDTMSATQKTSQQALEHARLENQCDKFLLALFVEQCLGGEEHGMKAVELVSLMKDKKRMIPVAMRAAANYNVPMVEEKVKELGERLEREAMGYDDDDVL